MAWTDQNIELLKQRWGNGFSAQQIAVEIGGITRCAVIGKARRLGLAERQTQQRPRITNGKLKLPKLLTHKERKKNEVALRKISLLELAEALEATEVDQSAEAVTLELLEHHHCRWPCGTPGTPEFRFCGANKISESSYCARHHRMAYTRPREPRVYHFRQAAE